MKRFLTRASVAGLSAALVAGVALVAAPAASAAQIGSLTFNGLDLAAGRVHGRHLGRLPDHADARRPTS